MFCLSSISPFQLVIIGTVLTFLISDDMDAAELNVIGNLVVAVGSLVLTVAAQKEFIKDKQDNKDMKEDIKRQIKYLQDKYDKMD